MIDAEAACVRARTLAKAESGTMVSTEVVRRPQSGQRMTATRFNELVASMRAESAALSLRLLAAPSRSIVLLPRLPRLLDTGRIGAGVDT